MTINDIFFTDDKSSAVDVDNLQEKKEDKTESVVFLYWPTFPVRENCSVGKNGEGGCVLCVSSFGATSLIFCAGLAPGGEVWGRK